MLRQRIIAAVVVRQGRAVQSFGYKRWLPLGDVACIVQNLDNWGADGIAVLNTDRGLNGPDLKLLRKLSSMGLSTPLSYGGGIRTASDAQAAVQAGAERIMVDRILTESPQELPKIAAAVGCQALVASIPMRVRAGKKLDHWNYWSKQSSSLKHWLSSANWHKHVSEILAIDVEAEGSQKGPNLEIIEALTHLDLPILSFGGLSHSDQIIPVLQTKGVAGVVVGNALNYHEDSIRMLKDNLKSLPVRPHPSKKIEYGN